MDRKLEIWESDKDERIDMFASNIESFQNNMDVDSSIADGFLRHFAELFQMLSIQQESGAKGPLRYITISFPRSSVVAETYELVTACHTVDIFMDETETETYWPMDFYKEIVDRDMAIIVPKLKKNIFRIRGFEIEEFRNNYAFTYTVLLIAFFGRVIHQIFDLPEFQAVQKDDQVDITFGGYMDEAIILTQYAGTSEH